jgi:hypothetical protein
MINAQECSCWSIYKSTFSFSFKKYQTVFQSVCATFHSPCNIQEIHYSASSPEFGVITFFSVSCSDKCMAIPTCGFSLSFPVACDYENLFVWISPLIATSVFFFVKFPIYVFSLVKFEARLYLSIFCFFSDSLSFYY